MLGTDVNGMTLSIMASIYARRAKETQSKSEGATALTMYAFYDAMERTAVAFNQVLDAKRTPKEALDLLVDYASRLELELTELGDEDANDSSGEE